MLSSCRRLASSSSPSSSGSVRKLLLCTRFSTATAGSSGAGGGGGSRLVISRRVWQAHAKTLPKKPKIKVDSPHDKPWPQSVQLAGYAAACIFIPYASIWLITSNPSLREVFEGILPFDKFRKHFGEEEWNVYSYVDRGVEEELKEEYFQFPGEPPLRERRQQTIIEEFDSSKISVNLYAFDDGNNQSQQTKEVAASTRANRKVLSELLGTAVEAKSVAVDFLDDQDAEQSSSLFGDIVTSSDGSSIEDAIHPLISKMNIFAMWHYLPTQQAPQEASNRTNADLEIPRLEYIIDDLEKKLKDPSCTRDIDDMMTELNQAKKDLRRLKWKRRLGWKN